MITCPSDLRLETYLLAPRRSGVADHVGTCAACRARLDEMRRLGEEFEREVYPALAARAASVPRPRPSPGPVRWIRWAVPLAAAAGLTLVVLWRAGPLRRPELRLAVYVDAARGVEPLPDGAEVPANASLRFQVQPGAPCSLWVLSVDATGDIARLYPPKGDKAAEALVLPPQLRELPTVAVLDGRAGPQRIFAVCTRSPVPWLTVKQAAAQELGKGDEAVRGYRSIGNLPRGSSQSTVLLEKRS